MEKKLISTIYYEVELKNHPRVQALFKRFNKVRKIPIDRYTEVFNKRNQNFKLQKQNPALILAKKYENFVLPVPSGFGISETKGFYFSHMYNCIYDCRYCFLQGLYSSSNFVLFVNYEDFEKEIENTIRKYEDERITFFSGYDCDSLALESITDFVKTILPVFERYPHALLELRTKSIQLVPLVSTDVLENCVVAYSLMPDEISSKLDIKAPSLRRRLNAMRTLAKLGWKIGLRFDPLVHGKDWQLLYKDLIDQVFCYLPKESVHSVSFGALRFPKRMFKKIVNLYPDEVLFSESFSTTNGVISYSNQIESEMIKYCMDTIREFVPSSIVYNCSFSPTETQLGEKS